MEERICKISDILLHFENKARQMRSVSKISHLLTHVKFREGVGECMSEFCQLGQDQTSDRLLTGRCSAVSELKVW